MTLFMKHFMDPKNVGTFVHPDCVEKIELKEHNLKVVLYAQKTDGGVRLKYKVIGCSVAIVMCSFLSDLLENSGTKSVLSLDFAGVYSKFSDEPAANNKECAEVTFNLFKKIITECTGGK